ncbi:MAG: XisH family protein [Desulfococcaceae bacterium]|jgi:hypothetical protein|nr:XisH family protein [Desulfococcaceae bacterium]
MPQKDLYHDLVKKALISENWNITDDPLFLSFGGKNTYVDLGAEKIIGAEKNNQRIAVEIKSFLGPSQLHDLELAIGQYNLYRDMLSEIDPERLLFLAVPNRIFKSLLNEPLGELIRKRQNLLLIIFDEHKERILQWLTQSNTTVS